jgi:hypothetical protein
VTGADDDSVAGIAGHGYFFFHSGS